MVGERVELRTSRKLNAIIDDQPGTNGRAAKIIELVAEALIARGVDRGTIEDALPPLRGKYPRTKSQQAHTAPEMKEENDGQK